jgi:hypothetical protein
MRRIVTLFGVSAMTVFAFSVITVAAASAAEPTKTLPEPTAEKPLNATVTQEAEGQISTVGGLSLKCKKAAGRESWTSANLGTWNLLFTECKGPLKTVCTGTGDPSGLVAAQGEVHFWLALNMYGSQKEPKSELVGALVFLRESSGVKLVCGSPTVEDAVVVKGCLAAHVLPTSLNTLISKAHEEFEEWLSGETSILSVLPQESTKEIPCLPRVSVNGGSEELAALSGLFWVEKFEKGGAGLTIELMNP